MKGNGNMKHSIFQRLLAFTLLLVVPFVTGCPYMDGTGGGIVVPPPDSGGGGGTSGNAQQEYDLGFEAGFARDDWYWDGYFDGYYTVSRAPIYYDDSGIPYLESPPYDAGYWDGVWYAYNDGYFVDYHYAFIVGFSEGYDNAYWPDYLTFLASDRHTEYYHGGWIDGYNDGYSEGRVFGANDYEQGIPFDWLGALRDYEQGVDLYFEEVGVGTGVWGPVILYEYGTNPNLSKQTRVTQKSRARSIRQGNSILRAQGKDDLGSLYRPFREDARTELQVTPSSSLRNTTHNLRLNLSWYDRVVAYHNEAKTGNRVAVFRNRVVPFVEKEKNQ